MPKNIELEIRAIIKKEEFDAIFKKLTKTGKLVSKTNRLSIMFYGTCGKNSFDTKVRITDGKSEVVIKKGDFHAHDRTEYSQDIANSEFLNMVRIFSQFGFGAKVYERLTYNIQFPGDIMLSLAKAGNYSYLEIEKMTDKKSQGADKIILENIAKDLGVTLIKDGKAYYDFCDMLTEKVDWSFSGSKKDFLKLEKCLKQKLLNKI
jgi:adenylate cyclase class IV